MSMSEGTAGGARAVAPEMEADLTAKARIRNAALRLFATHGEGGTSLRAIASEASVTVGLITHHFGSKARLRQAVDEYVALLFAEAIASVPAAGTTHEVTQGRDAAVVEMLEQRPDVLNYLRRDMLDPSAPSSVLAGGLASLAREQVRSLRAAGLASTRQAETTQAVSMIVRILGRLFLQPLVDRMVTALEPAADGLRPELVVSVRE